MILSPIRKRRENIKLKGAVQISHNTFFIYSDSQGKTFLKTGEDKKLNKRLVKRMIFLSPTVDSLLKRYKIKPSIDVKTLKALTGGHMNDTCNVAMGVYSYLPDCLKIGMDKASIKEASMLHDLGKVLIPSKILHKPAKLNVKEREIMNIHSTLGYELLKTQNLKEETLELVKYHHQNLKKSGYPDVEDLDKFSDIAVQIISIADKYSALREARVYRKKLSRVDAMLVLYKEVREGKILPEVYNALVKYAANSISEKK